MPVDLATLDSDRRKSIFFRILAPLIAAVPAVVHVDGSGRLQTVERDHNPRYHALIERFFQRTGCPVLVNTSFNVRGEPIVCTPEHAYVCFMRTNMDYLVLWPFLLERSLQPEWREEEDWHTSLQTD